MAALAAIAIALVAFDRIDMTVPETAGAVRAFDLAQSVPCPNERCPR